MKIAIFALFSLFSAASASAEVIEFTLEVPPAALRQDDKGFTHLAISGYENLAAPASPLLPARQLLLALTPGQSPIEVKVEVLEEKEIAGRHLVFPAQRKYPPSYRGPRPFTPPDPQVYGMDSLWPEGWIEQGALQYFRGVAMLPVLVRPVRYNPVLGKLVQATGLKIRVVCQPTKAISPNYRGLDRDLEEAARLAANPEVLSVYHHRSGAKDGEYRYLIVTGGGLDKCPGPYNLQALSDARSAEGLTVQMVTMEQVQAESVGADGEEKLRNFIAREYRERGVDFVLLVGDADLEVVGGETETPLVPARGLWGDIDYGGAELNLLSDLYFAALDGDFDANRNRVFGEPDDEPDLLPEVAVGRAPADSCQEVANFVRKTLEYAPRQDSDLRQAWFAGEILGPDSFGCDFLTPMVSGSSEEGISTRGFADSGFFETYFLCEPLAGGREWTKNEILSLLNGGVHILNHLGHSMTNDNMRLNCDDLDAELSNQKSFFDYSGGCYPGSFDNRLDPVYSENRVSPQDSIAEHLLLGPYGAMGVVMFTRYGVGEIVQRTFWHAVFGHGLKRLGEIHNLSRALVAPLINDRYVRWQAYSLTLFGDPALELHLSDSQQPLLGLLSGPVQLYARTGDEKSRPMQIAVRNDGGGTLNWQAQASQSWLKIEPEMGTAPQRITLSANTASLPANQYNAEAIFSSAEAANSPLQLPVELYIVEVPKRTVSYVSASPQIDGAVSENEYPQAAFMDVGLVAAGRSVGRMVHDGRYLYLGLSLADDPAVDSADALILLFDNDNDDKWPEQPADEGIYYFCADGSVYYRPV